MSNEETPGKQDELNANPAEVQGTPNETPPPIEDWASAFESLEPKPKEDADADDESGEPAKSVPGETPPVGDKPGTNPEGKPDATDKPGGTGMDEGIAGGAVPDSNQVPGTDGEGIGTAGIQEKIATYSKEIEQQAIKDAYNAFVNSKNEQGQLNIRQTNGKLGATINDPDIYKRDENGIPTFYNPDTGRPFEGDNPRAQAKAWVEGYNEELKDSFNILAARRQTELTDEAKPVMQLLEFTPTYEGLDPVRQQMFDALIEDHEIYDNQGNHIGYSCDLNQKLAQVERQVDRIRAQQSAGAGAPGDSTGAQAPAAPNSPALDMPTGSSTGMTGKKPEFKSIAEAMEWEQNQLLENMKGKK